MKLGGLVKAKAKSLVCTTSASKKSLFHCRICPQAHKSYSKLNDLLSHYINVHFSTEINSFIYKGVCKLCGCNERKIERHVGFEHKKIEEIIKSKNLWIENWKPKGSKKTTGLTLKSEGQSSREANFGGGSLI